MNCLFRKYVLSMVVAISFAVTGPVTRGSMRGLQAKDTRSQQLVRFVVVNMSGSDREVQAGDTVVALPVAMRVALQVPAGVAIRITSRTDQSLRRVMVISATDEGRVVPVE